MHVTADDLRWKNRSIVYFRYHTRYKIINNRSAFQPALPGSFGGSSGAGQPEIENLPGQELAVGRDIIINSRYAAGAGHWQRKITKRDGNQFHRIRSAAMTPFCLWF
jgi:hypothetical protein